MAVLHLAEPIDSSKGPSYSAFTPAALRIPPRAVDPELDETRWHPRARRLRRRCLVPSKAWRRGLAKPEKLRATIQRFWWLCSSAPSRLCEGDVVFLSLVQAADTIIGGRPKTQSVGGENSLIFLPQYTSIISLAPTEQGVLAGPRRMELPQSATPEQVSKPGIRLDPCFTPGRRGHGGLSAASPSSPRSLLPTHFCRAFEEHGPRPPPGGMGSWAPVFPRPRAINLGHI